jgi:hypothetical protein
VAVEVTDGETPADGDVADAVAGDTGENGVMPCFAASMVILDARSFWPSANSRFARGSVI